VVDDGFTAFAVTMFLLDDSGSVAWLALPNYCAITVAMGSLAHSNTGSHWASMHADFVRDRRRPTTGSIRF
jgi:hypothetical protein